MPGRVSSPQFVGREPELDQLEAACKAAAAEERTTTVLLGGEAGVGKTRLVAELAGRVRAAGGLVLTGSCLELANAPLPFGPLVQALRALQRALDPATLEAVIGPAAEVIERLLPDVPGTIAHDDARAGALFEHLVGVLERLGDRYPTLIVLEDLHWADHSTRDLLLFLSRNLHDARVTLLGTYRSDDLHRRHPLRGVLAELERAGTAQRMELGRFDREELREMISSILGSEPSPSLVDGTFARSEGNAFFAEELVAARESGTQLPESLRDIVLTRTDSLSENARRLLHIVAVAGPRADYRLIAELSGMTEATLSESLRDATGHHVLVVEQDRVAYQFRHALVREAVYDDLLPGERVGLHTRVAELLETHREWCEGGPTSLTSELASHWYAAHDARRALVASLDAARDAERMYAYPEALAHVERALELWPQVPDAASLCGARHLDVLRYAATQADLTGDTDRAIEFICAAVSSPEADADPATIGLLQEQWARGLQSRGRPVDEVLEHADAAVALVPPEATVARARVLATQGQQLMLAGRWDEALQPCKEAIELAQQADDGSITSHARNTLGISLVALGDEATGFEQLRQSREEALAVGSWSDVLRAYTNEASGLSGAARHEEALNLSLEGITLARERGPRPMLVHLRSVICEPLWTLGRWAELEEWLDSLDGCALTGVTAWTSEATRAEWCAARGDFAGAHAHRDRLRVLLGEDFDERWQFEQAYLDVAIALCEDDPAVAVQRAQEGLGWEFDGLLCADTHASTAITLYGMAAATQLSERARDRGDDELQLRTVADARAFAEQFEKRLAEDLWGPGRPGDRVAIAHQIDAELASIEGRGNADEWAAVADEWAAHGMLPRVAYARWRDAELRVTNGDRSGATSAARAAYEIADSIGWQWVRARVTDLARRARMDVVPSHDAKTDENGRCGLTAREADVLRLVAAGRTNRQIAEKLFISTKTASAHVSNVLTKLGVSNRAEAGAEARRLGLD